MKNVSRIRITLFFLSLTLSSILLTIGLSAPSHGQAHLEQQVTEISTKEKIAFAVAQSSDAGAPYYYSYLMNPYGSGSLVKLGYDDFYYGYFFCGVPFYAWSKNGNGIAYSEHLSLNITYPGSPLSLVSTLTPMVLPWNPLVTDGKEMLYQAVFLHRCKRQILKKNVLIPMGPPYI
jgi:hypothetical protein